MTFNANDYQLNRYAQVHARAIAHLGGCCAKCGSVELLEIDHIDPSTKSFNISSRTCLSWERILDELAKCQALCQKCHKDKSDEEMQIPHGSGKTGRRNCRCELCAPLKRKAQREYTARNRANRASGRIGTAL